MNILIVEDEKTIAEGLRFNFEQEGYAPVVASNGPTALRFLSERNNFDLVVLDLMLPGMSGFEICKEIRASNQTIPIMVLSAKMDAMDKAHAFDCGANQYVTKPFVLTEVLSRVRNLLRSQPTGSDDSDSGKSKTNQFSFDNVEVDCEKFEVRVDGKTHSLTTMEMQLLQYFLEHPEMVLSRAKIMENVWEQSPEITTRTIDNFVMRLRRIIEPEPSKPRYILSVRGTGYRFVTHADPE